MDNRGDAPRPSRLGPLDPRLNELRARTGAVIWIGTWSRDLLALVAGRLLVARSPSELEAKVTAAWTSSRTAGAAVVTPPSRTGIGTWMWR